MAKASLWRSSTRRALVLGLTLFVLCGWLAAALHAPAQTKSDPAGDPKKTQPDKGTDVIAGGGVEQIAYINEQLDKKWKDNKIEPAKRCTDYEFIRRATLDIIGRIAKPTEIKEFLGWSAEQRRSKLIEKLLSMNKGEDFASNFATLWANLLMTRTGPKKNHEQMHVWLTEEFSKKDADWSKTVTSLLSAVGQTNGDGDAPAVNFILAHLGERLPDGNVEKNGQWELVPLTSRITRLFLGLRTQCTQCHDHPFNDEWRQENFWGINAYLRQVEAPKGRPSMVKNKKGGPDPQFEIRDNVRFNKTAMVSFDRRSGLAESTKAFFLDGTKLPGKLEGTRRQELARRVTTSEYFAKAFVNRTWGHFFGHGFNRTKDVDDFGEHNPIAHPDLLNKIAKDWATKYNHNPKDLIRWICNSKAYGLSSQANSSTQKPDTDKLFGRMLLKAMTPEQLFESLLIATDAKDGQNADKKKTLRDDWMNKLVVNFGDDEGNEGSFNGTIVQALLMMNGKELNEAIMDETHGTVATVMARLKGTKGPISRANQEAAVRELFLASLNRPPTAKELARMLDPERMSPTGSKKDVIDFPYFRAYCQDLYWAVLNSNEFILNH
jgi:hypothetical protein